jgi:hypothetical protein
MDLSSFLLSGLVLCLSAFVIWLCVKAVFVAAWIGDNLHIPLLREILIIFMHLFAWVLGPIISLWMVLFLIWSGLSMIGFADFVLPGFPWRSIGQFLWKTIILLLCLHLFLPINFAWSRSYLSPLFPTLTKHFGFSLLSGPKLRTYYEVAITFDRYQLGRLRPEHFAKDGDYSQVVLPRRELFSHLLVYWTVSVAAVLIWSYSLVTH